MEGVAPQMPKQLQQVSRYCNITYLPMQFVAAWASGVAEDTNGQ